jgi:hypothetical protein
VTVISVQFTKRVDRACHAMRSMILRAPFGNRAPPA